MFGFSKKNNLINNNWFVQNGFNYYKDSGRNVFNLYLNLSRFIRQDVSKFKNEQYYITSIKMLYDAMNYHGRLLNVPEIHGLICKLEEFGVIDVVSHSNFKRRKDIPPGELIILKDLDYSSSEHYTFVPFDVVEYILENGLTYNHVALFLFSISWEDKTEGKSYVSIDKAGRWLGFSAPTIRKYIKDLNQLRVMASHTKWDKIKNRKRYEHYTLKGLDESEKFEEYHGYAMDKFKKKVNK